MVLRAIAIFLLLASVAFFSFFGANEDRLSWFETRPAVTAAAKYDATVVRDRFGVPHIFARRDADAAFGLAYAHAEDDFATVQRALLSARGKLAVVDGRKAAEEDYFVQILGIWDAIAAHYETDLSPETRAMLDGYIAGLNLYAAQHPGEVLVGFAPAKPQDVVALFMLRLPLFYGLDNQLRELIAGNADKVAGDLSLSRSLAAAVAPARSADGATRLLINPQGPFAGPLSWYEASISSAEGWNRQGGLIPGSPVLLVGAGLNSGWGISANHPDLVDIYALKTNPADPNQYWFDGAWRRLETRQARIVTRLWGPIRVISRRPLLRAIQGPAFRGPHGLFAIRYAGQDDVKGVEAFFRLDKAQDYNAFTGVLAAGDIPSLSFVYADRSGRIASIYNGAFPNRASGYDWSHPVPGDVSADLWTSYLPFTAVPKTIAPGSGFVVAANSTPLRVTTDPFNPKPETFAPSMGIETGLNNRTRRALALLSVGRTLTAEAFAAFKFDKCFAPDSDFAAIIKDLAERNYAGDPLLEEAGEDLRRYNLCTDARNRAAALAVITAAPLLQASARGVPRPDAVATLRNAAARLLSQYARLDPEWGVINRLKRDELNLPLGGAPDALRDIELAPNVNAQAKSNAQSGDSLIMVSTWPKTGPWQIDSIVPFGNSRDSGTNRYDNQAQLYAQEKLKSVPLDPGLLLAQATAIERPGKTSPRGVAPPRTIPPAPPNFTFGAPANAAERTR
jgi:acyl-homoserine-lactone acylase